MKTYHFKSVQKYLWVILLAVCTPLFLQAQDELNDDGNEHIVDGSGDLDIRKGSPTYLKIPDNPINDFIEFTLRGADGGKVTAGGGWAMGGDGATVKFIVEIGTGPNQLAPGTVLRMMPGSRGQDHNVGKNHGAVSGGGGGTGILLKDGQGKWTIPLAVAGGGGGAFAGSFSVSNGQGGRADESGGTGSGVDGSDGGADGTAGSGGGDYSGKPGAGVFTGYPDPAAQSGKTTGQGGEAEYGGDGGWGCGGGGGGYVSGNAIYTFYAGGGGGYSGGGGSGTDGAGGGGGSYLHPNLTQQGTKTKGGASEPTQGGQITYRFFCSARFTNSVTVMTDAFCYGSEVIQLQAEARSYCKEISYRWEEAGEENTDGIFGNDTPLLPGKTYQFQLLYGGEVADTYAYTVSSTTVDEEPPGVLCQSYTFDLNDDPNPSVSVDDLVVGKSDNCGIAILEISDFGDSRSFDCSDLGVNKLTVRAEDHVGNYSLCTANVEITGGYPVSVTYGDHTVKLGETLPVSLAIEDLNFGASNETLCFSYDDIKANYHLPAEFQQLDCSDIGAHTVHLERDDTSLPDISFTLTVTDDILTTASVADLTLTLDDSGVATLQAGDLDFTVSDNCLSEAEIIAAYSVPADFTSFDCNRLGTHFVSLDRSDAGFPEVIARVTVQSGSLNFEPVYTPLTANATFDLTSLEDQITSANGTFTYALQTERLYVPNFGDNSVSMIDLTKNTYPTNIPVGTQPMGVAVHPNGLKVYVTNYGSDQVSIIDVFTNTVEATVSVGDGPWGIALNSDGSRAYVTNAAAGTVSVINTETHALIGSPITVGTEPIGIAVSAGDQRVFVANRASNTVSVINTTTNSVSTVAVGNMPRAIAGSPDGTKIYVTHSGGSGSISVLDGQSGQIIQNVNIQNVATDLAVGPTGDVYSCLGTSQPITIMHPGSSYSVDEYPILPNENNLLNGISVNEDGSLVYITDSKGNQILVFQPENNALVQSIPVGSAPMSIGDFYQKVTIPIASPTSYQPTVGDVIQVTFDGGTNCSATTTITFTASGG